MSAEPHMRHHAFVYESDQDYVHRAVPFVSEGLDTGEAAVVAATRHRIALVRDALGPAAERVAFTDVGSAYTRPARTIAAYHATLLGCLRDAPSVRVLAEVQFGPTPADWAEWGMYEALTTCAYPHLPAWVVCTYGAEDTPQPVLENVWRAHPKVLTADWQESSHFEHPEVMARDMAPKPQPVPGLRALAGEDDPDLFRERLVAELASAGVPASRTLDMLVAAGEVEANARIHGGGMAEWRVGSANGRFVCEIVDRGTGFDDPTAGYVAPLDSERGSGLWIARQLAWGVEHFDSPDGHTARIRL